MKIAIEQEKKTKKDFILYIRYAIILLLLSIIHLTLLDFISVVGLTPDLILILVVWIAVSEGRFVGIIAGFACGLFFDIVSLGVIGTNALAKTVVGLIAGSFHHKSTTDQMLGSYKFVLIVTLCGFVNNLIYFFFYLKSSEAAFAIFFLKYGVAVTLYTSVFSIFAMLIKIPRKGFRPF